jgi:phage shock protein C
MPPAIPKNAGHFEQELPTVRKILLVNRHVVMRKMAGTVALLIRQPRLPLAFDLTFGRWPSVLRNRYILVYVLLCLEDTMYCNYCGKLIQDDANVCAYCGTRVGSVLARKRLLRPRAERKVAGVCAGFAEYFDLDVTLVRAVWLISVFLGVGLSLIAYVVAWIVMPTEQLMLPAPAAGAQHLTSP